MKKIVVTQYGVNHYYAQCNECDWVASILSDGLVTRAQVRNAVQRHVRATGHTVVIESGKSTAYSLASEGENG